MEYPTETDGFASEYLGFDARFMVTTYYRARLDAQTRNMQKMLDPCNPSDFLGYALRMDSMDAAFLATQAY
jgi:hypothetical protein